MDRNNKRFEPSSGTPLGRRPCLAHGARSVSSRVMICQRSTLSTGLRIIAILSQNKRACESDEALTMLPVVTTLLAFVMSLFQACQVMPLKMLAL